MHHETYWKVHTYHTENVTGQISELKESDGTTDLGLADSRRWQSLLS